MAWIELTVVLVEVAGCIIGAIWCVTYGLGFVVYHLGCSPFFTVGEHRIVIRYYGSPLVVGVARCCFGVARFVSFARYNPVVLIHLVIACCVMTALI